MTTPALQEEPQLRHGMLWKRGRKVTSLWKRRYFVLRPTTLSYHTGDSSSERRFIELTQATSVILRKDKHPLAFEIKTKNSRKITVKGESEEDVAEWVSAIEDCVQQAPAWPIKCCIVGDDEEKTKGKKFVVAKYVEVCKDKAIDGEAKLWERRTKVLNEQTLGNVDVMLEYRTGGWVKLMLWQLQGSEEWAKFRTLAYPHTDVFVVVFSVSDSKSFEKVDAYVKEIRAEIKAIKTTPPVFLLVGTRLSSEFVSIGFNVAEEKARELGFSGYVECRLNLESDCEEVFSHAVRIVVERALVSSAPLSENLDSVPEKSHTVAGFLKHKPVRRLPDLMGGLHHGSDDGSSTSSPTNNSGSFRSSFLKSGVSPDASLSKSFYSIFKAGSSRSLTSDGVPLPSLSQTTLKHGLSKLPLTAVDPPASAVSHVLDVEFEEEITDDEEDDDDEGSLIGVEIDDDDEEAKARVERDFGLNCMKDDDRYTRKIMSARAAHTSSTDAILKRLGEPMSGSQSVVSGSLPDLFNILETPAEEHERLLEEQERKKEQERKRKRENQMRQMKASVDAHNKLVDDQLRAMGEELTKVGNSRTGPPPLASVAPPKPLHVIAPHSSQSSSPPVSIKTRASSVFF